MNDRLILVAILAVLVGGGAIYFFVLSGGDEVVNPGPGGSGAVPASVETGDASGEPAVRAPLPRTRPSTIPRQPRETGASERRAQRQRGGLPRIAGVIRNEEGHFVEGAAVSVIVDVSPIATRPQDGDTVATMKSDRNGEFHFESLSVGERYIVRADHPGYTVERRENLDVNARTDQFLEITLKNGSRIAGRVATLAGNPVEGAVVTVYDMRISAFDPDQSRERDATTGADGRYVIAGVSPGLKKVTARRAKLGTMSRTPVEIESGRDLADLDFALGEGLAISGTIRDQNGAPVVDARVTVRLVARSAPATPDAFPEAGESKERRALAEQGDETGDEPGREGEDGGAAQPPPKPQVARPPIQVPAVRQPQTIIRGGEGVFSEQAVSDDEGRYAIDGLVAGSYAVTVQCAGYQPAAGKTLQAGTEGNDFTLTANPWITGRVVDDETGAPVADFAVYGSRNRFAGLIPRNQKRRFSNPEGTFELRELPPGVYWIMAEAPGYAGGRTPDSVTLSAAGSVSDVEIRLVRGATVTGRVVDRAGAGVAGAEVEIESRDEGHEQANHPFVKILTSSMRATRSGAVTDHDGRFRIENVLEGSWALKVSHAGFSPRTSDPFSVPAKGEHDTGDFALAPGGSIRGTVRPKEGEELKSAKVMVKSVSDPMLSRNVEVGPAGAFEFTGLPPGEYQVIVMERNGVFDLMALLSQSAQGGQKVLVQVPEGGTAEIEVQ